MAKYHGTLWINGIRAALIQMDVKDEDEARARVEEYAAEVTRNSAPGVSFHTRIAVEAVEG